MSKATIEALAKEFSAEIKRAEPLFKEAESALARQILTGEDDPHLIIPGDEERPMETAIWILALATVGRLLLDLTVSNRYRVFVNHVRRRDQNLMFRVREAEIRMHLGALGYRTSVLITDGELDRYVKERHEKDEEERRVIETRAATDLVQAMREGIIGQG